MAECYLRAGCESDTPCRACPFEFDCPSAGCPGVQGRRCRRPSGHDVETHESRRLLADRAAIERDEAEVIERLGLPATQKFVKRINRLAEAQGQPPLQLSPEAGRRHA